MSAHPLDCVAVIGSCKIVTWADPHDDVLHTAEIEIDRDDVTIHLTTEEPDFFAPSRSFSIPLALWIRMQQVTA